MSVPLHFIGLLKSPVSWARVGRELLRALADEGARVSAVSLKGYLYDDGFPLPAEAEKAVAQKRLPGWDLALDYPPNFARLNGQRKAGIIIYEADRLPEHWVAAINAHLDLAIVPSAFCMKAALASGVATKISVVPFGVDQCVFAPGPASAPAASGRSFSFLTVGAPHVRKGLKETVEAFCSAFPADRDVGLVVKCPPVPQAGRRPWEYGRVDDFLPDTRGGRITMLQGGWDDERMVSLYRACDVYVQASYGEAFGLAAVEAAACGKPVITTNWGTAGEIFDRDSAYLVDYDLVDADAFAYDWPQPASPAKSPPKMAKPRVESLAAAMRLAYEDATLRKRKGEAALAAVRPLTWEATAWGLIRALAD